MTSPLDAYSAPTTVLQAVNFMLAAIGEAPINTLTTPSTIAATAMNRLGEVNRETQAEGWAYNTDSDLVLDPNSSGQIVLPANTLRVRQVTACLPIPPGTNSGGIASATVASGGSGGTPGVVVLTVVGGTGNAATLNGLINGSGVLASISGVASIGQYTAFPSSPAAVTGGGLTGATVNLQQTQSVQPTGPALVMVPGTLRSRLTVRNGMLYDRIMHTFNLGVSCEVDLTVTQDFEEIPQNARWFITVKAARRLAQGRLVSGTVYQFTSADEQQARVRMEQEEDEAQEMDGLEGNPHIQFMRQK